MKKNGILNSEISSALSSMGHTDCICIGDCGLPIPDGTKRIDLAVKFGEPAFLDVLKEVAGDMKVEKAVLAEEMKDKSKELYKDTEAYLRGQEEEMEISFVPHEELKRMTENCKAVIRTGETTPYANIILQSGCIF